MQVGAVSKNRWNMADKIDQEEKSFLDFLFDTGTNVFSRVLDAEVEAYEFKKLAKARAFDEAAIQARNDRFLDTAITSGQAKTIVGVSSLLSIAMLVAAAVLMIGRK